MNTRTFSIIIPTLNEEKYIGACIQSVMQQTDTDFEIIIVDAKSTDRTRDIVRTTGGSVCTLYDSRVASAGVQRNIGARHASGTWLVFLDADNTLLPTFLSTVREYVRRHRPVVLTTWCRPDSESRHDAIVTLLNNLIVESSVSMGRQIAPGGLTIVRSDVFRTMGGFNESHRYGEDVDLGKSYAEHGYRLAIIRETLYVWSLRRFRKEGTITILQKFALSVLSVLVLRRTPKSMPGYDLGGALYEPTSGPKLKEMLRTYQKKISSLVKELFP